MYVRIEKELVMQANIQAMNELRQSALCHWCETEQYIYHIFCAGSIESLNNLKEILSRHGIDADSIREDQFVDDIGVAHQIFEMQGEDKLVLHESVITNRITEIFELIENTSVEYIGWKCSSSTGMSNSSTDLPDPFIGE